MRNVIPCVILACCALRSIAGPVIPSDVEELVPIPGRMIAKSRVHIVPEGSKIVHSATQIELLDAEGNVLHSSSTSLNTSTPIIKIPRSSTAEPDIDPRSLQSATIFALAQVPTLSSFDSNWILPPLPQVNNGQLLMYSSALAPASIDAVIQPTLQYGVSAAGGGAFWSVASWYITAQQVFVTNLTKITQEPGQLTLSTFVINQDQFLGTPTTHAWFTGFTGFSASFMNIQTTEAFTVAIVELQISGATTLSNLPTGPTDIQRIVILDANDQTFFPIPWVYSNDTTDKITINRIPNNLSSNEVLFFQYGT